MSLRYKSKPKESEVRVAYLLGRLHIMKELSDLAHEGNPYPHDDRGWAYLDGIEDYGNRWNEDHYGKPPSDLDIEVESLRRYGPRPNVEIDSPMLRILKNLNVR